MNHPIAYTLDICMMKLFNFLNLKNPQAPHLNEMERQQKTVESLKFLRILIKAFDDVILPIHNTHHAQFILFYFCSFKVILFY